MAQIDPDDDEIRRFLVRRYIYDSARCERRHVVVAAYDSEAEFRAAIDALSAELRRRREAGEDVDLQEHVTGVVLDPGYRRKQQGGRIIKHAVEHGASLSGEAWDRLTSDLPPGMAVFRYESEPEA